MRIRNCREGCEHDHGDLRADIQTALSLPYLVFVDFATGMMLLRSLGTLVAAEYCAIYLPAAPMCIIHNVVNLYPLSLTTSHVLVLAMAVLCNPTGEVPSIFSSFIQAS